MYLEEDLDLVLKGVPSLEGKLLGSTVLLTGAGGFLGRYFVAVIKKLNSEHPDNPVKLIANDVFITSKQEFETDLDPNIVWIIGDASLSLNYEEKFDYIIHAAGIASPKFYKANPLETIDVSVGVTKLLLERARKDSSRVLFFSSSEIYGDPTEGNVPTPESYKGYVSIRGERACYDESKRLGETLCWVYENYYSVFVCAVRPFNVYGPGMLPTDARVLPNFASQVSRNLPLSIYNNGNQTRTFCYITDALVGFLKVLLDSEKPDVYNVGNPSPEIGMKDLALKVLEISNSNAGIEIVEYPDSYPGDEPNRRCPDISKLSSNLGFQPQVSLNEGLTKFLNWAEENYGKIDFQ